MFFAALVALLLLIPFLVSVWSSLLSLDPAFPSSYGKLVGLKNFEDLIFNEPDFLNSLNVTGVLLLSGLLEFALAFMLALWLNRLWPEAIPVHLVMLLVLPYAVSALVTGLIGVLYLHDQVGILARLLKYLGVMGSDTAPLASPGGALVSICGLDAWHWVPITALLIWLSFRLVPRTEIEASRIDGLSKKSVVWELLLPRAAAALGIILVMRLLECLRLYDIPAVLTGGGPGTSTMTVSLYANRLAFVQQRLGLAAAQMTLLYIGVAILMLPLLRWTTRIRDSLRTART